MKNEIKEVINITNEGITKGIYNLELGKEVLAFQNLNDIEYYIVKNLKNTDCSLREFEFKLPHSTTYKYTSRTLIEDKGRGVSTFKMYFDAKFSGDGEFREPSIYLIYTHRFIKTKDQIILKNLESIKYVNYPRLKS